MIITLTSYYVFLYCYIITFFLIFISIGLYSVGGIYESFSIDSVN